MVNIDEDIMRMYKGIEKDIHDLKELLIRKETMSILEKNELVEKEEKYVDEEEEEEEGDYEGYEDYIVMVSYSDMFYVDGRDESKVRICAIQMFKDCIIDNIEEDGFIVKVEKI